MIWRECQIFYVVTLLCIKQLLSPIFNWRSSAASATNRIDRLVLQARQALVFSKYFLRFFGLIVRLCASLCASLCVCVPWSP